MKTEQYKKQLEEEKIKLESEMRQIGRKNPTVPNDWEPVSETSAEPDLADQADIIIGNENNAEIFADLEARYDMVLEALSRIENGSYGICEECDKEIEESRLRANPAATTCVAHL